MNDTRKPIERMIDAACGFVPGQAPVRVQRVVLLRCDKCKRTRRVVKDKTDPKGTVEIILPCPECWKDGTFEDPRYLDKNGKQIIAQQNT